jgi:hypothetical protein
MRLVNETYVWNNLSLQVDMQVRDQWHGSCMNNIRMKQIPVLRWLIIRKELIDGGYIGYSKRSGVSKIRKLAQHYLNGLRIGRIQYVEHANSG